MAQESILNVTAFGRKNWSMLNPGLPTERLSMNLAAVSLCDVI